MKCFALVLLAVVASATAGVIISPREDEDVALAFVECVRQALDGGLEEAQIPNHNPFKFFNDLDIPLTSEDIMVSLQLKHVEIDNIVDVDVESMIGTYVDDRSEIDYKFKFHYDQMVIKGDYVASIKADAFAGTASGPFSIALKNLSFTGDWDMNIASHQLRKFDLKILTGSVEVHIDGLGSVLGPVIDEAGSNALTYLINSDPDAVSQAISPSLEKRLNEMWLDDEHSYRIQAMLDHCKI